MIKKSCFYDGDWMTLADLGDRPFTVEEVKLDFDSSPQIMGSVLTNQQWITPYTLTIDPIEKVIFHDPATIVFWKDGFKTVVKCGSGDQFDAEKGLAMAIVKRYFGNKGNYNNILKKHLPKEEK